MASASQSWDHGPEAPTLRLFVASDDLDEANWTLRQFYELWFEPEVLRRERRSSESTITNYRQKIDWWEKLTSNPPLSAITRETLADFRDALRDATFTRARSRPGKPARRYPLSEARQAGILRDIRAILFRAGPDVDPKRPAKGILPKVPHIAVAKVDCDPKPAFSLERARRIAAACPLMTRPVVRGVESGKWCYGVLCGFAHTGLRREDVVTLAWSMFEEREDGIWLSLREQKTRKRATIFVHPELWLALQAIRTGSEFVFSIDRPHSSRRRQAKRISGARVAELLFELQDLAGIPKPQQQSPHAWRRTHLNWLDQAGYSAHREVLRSAANHADAATTEGSYVDLKNNFRRRLPWLCPANNPDARSRFDSRQQALFLA